MERVIYSPKFGAVEGVSPIVRGATDAETAPQAVANLGLVSQNSLGAAGGFAMLDANGDLQRNQLPSGLSKATRVDGPVAVLPNSRSVFTITNFDMETTYTLEEGPDTKITKGTGGLLYVDVTAAGSTWIKVNGTTYPIAVVETSPEKPTIISPVNGSAKQPFELLLTSAAFAMVAGSLYSDVHEASEWQLSADPTFPETDATTVNFSYTDLTTWAISGLSDVSTYYVRVRHQGKTYGFSSWSDTVGFTTRSLISSDIKAYVSDPFLSNGDLLGFSISGNANLTIVAAGAPCAKTPDNGWDPGKVVIFSRSGVLWNKLQLLEEPGTWNYGWSVSMSKDASVLVVGSPRNYSPEGHQEGSAYIYYRTGDTYSLVKKLEAVRHPTHRGSDLFGWSVNISGNGEVCYVGAIGAVDSAVTKYIGAVHIFSKATGWELVQTIRKEDLTNGSQFGYLIDSTFDGNTFITSAPYWSPWPHMVNVGNITWYSKQETGWVETGLTYGQPGSCMGYSLSLSDDGTTTAGGGSSNQSYVWKTVNGVDVGTYSYSAPDSSCCLSSDGNVWLLATPFQHHRRIGASEFKNGVWTGSGIYPTPETGYTESDPGHALLISDDKKVIVASCLYEGPNGQGNLYVFS